MNFSEYIAKYNHIIESQLRDRILHEEFPLYSMMKYHLGWIEKDGTPTLSGQTDPALYCIGALPLLINEIFGGQSQDALSSAVAIVLVENSALIHQDIQDGMPERSGRPSLWWHWGPAQAINAGDGMHALGRLALLENDSQNWSAKTLVKAISILDKACLDICEGQFVDITYTERVDVTLEDYMAMISKKSGALVQSSVVLGAMSAGCEDHNLENLAEYGLKLGLSIQIRNDILDLWCTDHQSRLSGDILNKKKSLPIVYALQNAKGNEKHILGDIYFKRTMENGDIERLVDVLDSMGARQYSQEILDSIKKECLSSLDNLNISKSGKDTLVEIATIVSNVNCE